MRALALIVLAATIVSAKTDNAARAEFDAYMSAAAGLRLTSGTEPYSATWEYTGFAMATNKNLTGHISVSFESPKKWREVISDQPGYTSVLIQNEDGRFEKANLAQLPMRERQLMHALEFFAIPDAEVRKLKASKIDGIESECFEVKGAGTYCFDPVRKLPLRIERMGLQFDYASFRTIGSRVVPERWTVSEHGKTIVQAELKDIAQAGHPSEALFRAPSGAKREDVHVCDNDQPVQGHLVSQVPPHYPEAAKLRGMSGQVILAATITKAGTVSGLQVLQGAGKLFDDEAIAAVKQWTYAPYMHCGQPIEVDTEITVNFNIR